MTHVTVLAVQVVAVTAVRTGAGKSQVSQYIATFLHEDKLKTALVRHPMPYGKGPAWHPAYLRNQGLPLTKQACCVQSEVATQCTYDWMLQDAPGLWITWSSKCASFAGRTLL